MRLPAYWLIGHCHLVFASHGKREIPGLPRGNHNPGGNDCPPGRTAFHRLRRPLRERMINSRPHDYNRRDPSAGRSQPPPRSHHRRRPHRLLRRGGAAGPASSPSPGSSWSRSPSPSPSAPGWCGSCWPKRRRRWGRVPPGSAWGPSPPPPAPGRRSRPAPSSWSPRTSAPTWPGSPGRPVSSWSWAP